MAHDGLRERKKQQTRMALRTAALRLTAERGLDRVTVEDIAQAADVSVRTFFNYFSSKEESVIGLEPGSMDYLLTVLASRPRDEAPLRSLQATFREVASGLGQARDVQVLRQQVLADNPSLLPRHVASFVEFERVLLGAVAERMKGAPDADAEAALIVAVVVAALRVCVEQWVAEDGADLLDMLDMAFDRLAAGLLPRADPATVPPVSPRPRTTPRKDRS